MASVKKPYDDVKLDFRLSGTEVAAFLTAQSDIRSRFYFKVVRVFAKRAGRPIHTQRHRSLTQLVHECFAKPLILDEYGPLDSRIGIIKDIALGKAWSLLRGSYLGSTAAGQVPETISWLLLDLDVGMIESLRGKLAPFLHFCWDTIRSTLDQRRLRLAIPLARPVNHAGHERLRRWLLGDYPGNHDDAITQAALLPIQRTSTSTGECSLLEVVGHTGRLLDLGDVPSSVKPMLHVVRKRRRADHGDHRLATAAAGCIQAQCSYLGIKVAAGSTQLPLRIHCPFGDHPDRHPSATVTATPDLWITCHSHPMPDGSRGSKKMPLGELHWRQRFKRDESKHLVLRPAEVRMYAARLLYDSQSALRPEPPLTIGTQALMQRAKRDHGAMMEIVDGQTPLLRFDHNGRTYRISSRILDLARSGTDLAFACNQFIHGQYKTTIAERFMGEWCGISPASYRTARYLLLRCGVIKASRETVLIKWRRPSKRGSLVVPRPHNRHLAQLFEPATNIPLR